MNKESAPDELIKAVQRLLAGGRYVSPALAEKLAGGLSSDDPTRPIHEILSDREFEVLRMIASGKTIGQIADQLHLSGTTVSTYRGRILKKLGLNTNVDLVHYAMKHRLIE